MKKGVAEWKRGSLNENGGRWGKKGIDREKRWSLGKKRVAGVKSRPLSKKGAR